MNPGLPTPPSFQGVIGRAVALGVLASLAALAHSWNSSVSVREIEPVKPINIPVPVPMPTGESPAAVLQEGEPAAIANAQPGGAQPGNAVVNEQVVTTPGDEAGTENDLPWFYIGTDEAMALFETGEAIFVDARLEREFVVGHIDGAYFLPASEFNDRAGEVVLNQIGPAQLIVIYCGGGECDASQNTANRLAAAGWTNYRIYHDGYEAWVAAGGLTNEGADYYGAIEE